MQVTIISALWLSPAIICAGGAVYMAIVGLDDWWWFLGAAFMLRFGFSVTSRSIDAKSTKREAI